MRGGGGAANREALPIPLGSTAALFKPPAFAGPRAMPLIGTFPVPPEPGLRANCANEAAGVARTRSTAKAILPRCSAWGAPLSFTRTERRMRAADVGSLSAATIKLKFRKGFDAGVRASSKAARGFLPGRSPLCRQHPRLHHERHQGRPRRHANRVSGHRHDGRAPRHHTRSAGHPMRRRARWSSRSGERATCDREWRSQRHRWLAGQQHAREWRKRRCQPAMAAQHRRTELENGSGHLA
jgi:hypothetical protein